MAKLGTATTISTSDNGYWRINNTRHPVHSMQLCHHDGTTAGAWTLYTSNREDAPIPDDDTSTPDLEYWSLETVTVTDPAASAAGSFMLHLSHSGAKQYLVRFLASAASSVSVYTHGKD